MSDDVRVPLVDSNILIYCYAEDSLKKEVAVKLIQDCFREKIRLHISLQNIGEFCSVATKRYNLDVTTVNRIVQAVLSSKGFIKLHYKETTFQQALFLAEKTKMKFWDALIAATMLENGINEIYTEDDAFKRVEGIKAVNIF